MSTRTFEHPLHRHPSVAPVLHLIEATPDMTLGRGGVQATVIQIRALEHVEAWAMRRFALSEQPAHAARLADRVRKAVPAVDDLVRLPAALAALYRYDEHDRELAETARLSHIEGPAAARAFVSRRVRPSLASRRLAEQGWWPSTDHAFVGRLDADVRPEDYRPSVPLVGALARLGRWTDAKRIAERLAPRPRLLARKLMLRRQVRVGIGPGPLPVPLQDEYLWQSARLSVERDNPSAANAFVDEMYDPLRRAFARHELRRQLGQLTAIDRPDVGLDGRGGVASLMRADVAIASSRPTQAWAHLCEAATGPRVDRRCWIDGVRPDLQIAQQLLFVTLKFGHADRWPWGRRRMRALLDRLDAVMAVVGQLAQRQVEDALGAVGSAWLRSRIRQALYVRSLERTDTATVERHLYGAPQAEAFLRGLMGDLAFGAQLSRDPADPVRALYDDGLARAPRAARRRASIISASCRTIRQSIDGNAAACAAAEVRLATLAHIGGERVRRSLAHRMDDTPKDHRLYPSLLRALVQIDGERFVPRAFSRPEATGNRIDATSLHEALEQANLVTRGFSSAVAQLRDAIIAAGEDRGDAWWFELCRSWWHEHQVPPSASLLHWMAILPPASLRQGPTAALARFAARRRAFAQVNQDRLLSHLVRDELALTELVLGTPFSSGYGVRWSNKQFKRVIDRLCARRSQIGSPDRAMVERWAGVRPVDVAESLLAGHPPLTVLEAPLRVRGRDQLELRYLHKCRDVLRFWRFADIVPCCFNSNGHFYLAGDTQRMVLQLWRDPLSFCFQILHKARAVGFVFGGFGQTPKDEVLVLNGIYMRRRADFATRGAIVDTIAEAMLRPLRLNVVGIANRNGGHGPLPADYEAKEQLLWRHRALKDDKRRRITFIYDDIGNTVNSWAPTNLHWKRAA